MKLEHAITTGIMGLALSGCAQMSTQEICTNNAMLLFQANNLAQKYSRTKPTKIGTLKDSEGYDSSMIVDISINENLNGPKNNVRYAFHIVRALPMPMGVGVGIDHLAYSIIFTNQRPSDGAIFDSDKGDVVVLRNNRLSAGTSYFILMRGKISGLELYNHRMRSVSDPVQTKSEVTCKEYM